MEEMDNRVNLMRFEEVIKFMNSENTIINNHSIMSGFDRFDKIKQGWFFGEFSIIGSRPSIGKTSFILSLISNLINKNIPVSLFSATDKLDKCFISRILAFLRPNEVEFNKDRFELLKTVDLTDVPFFLNCQHNMTLDYIKETSRILVNEFGVKCIFIEDLQSIFYSESKGNTREGMENICNELKKLARELNVPLIVTSDLNRSVEHREYSKRPLISDLYGSSAIENMADSVILLHRPEYYKIYQDIKGNDMRNIIELQIHKNKNRCIGDVIYRFNHDFGRVEEFKLPIPLP